MFKYCVINLRQGRGGAVKIVVSILAVFVIYYFLPMAKPSRILDRVGTLTSDQNVFAAESNFHYLAGSYDVLNLDSAKDILDVTKTVNEVVNDVVKRLTPTDFINPGVNLPINIPLNPLSHVQPLDMVLPSGGWDLTRFLSPAGVSTGDLTSILKGVAVLSIQIFIVVISVVSQIVK
ncbi:MAG: hypothetical protein WD989_01000, partial [Candidatus Paceibacterota bacterium]